MVGVAQLVELRLVMPAVVGSSPIVHPICLIDWIGFFLSDQLRGHFLSIVDQIAACFASA